MNQPNNYCGECPVWLAIDSEDGITLKEALEKYCCKCRAEVDSELD